MNFFKEIYYRIKLGTFLFNDSYNKNVNNMILKIMENQNEISEINESYFNLIIKFKDERIINLCNSNKYYAWLSECKSNFGIQYTDARPSIETMYKFKNFIIEYNITKTNNLMEL